ncbi:helix-turn-helix domain-containing protein [Nonomuraea sp. SYSU D8015]|uniref:helix-turn-helix domain-containing protein n=1 Tax=Nonomuraea sp. SYSU D8015 TaxID=2593644 RepID=UPI001CB71AB1|nr:helix-turn-helix transcriptional regulator [Nonomuraea sp. SYSU D8015]
MFVFDPRKRLGISQARVSQIEHGQIGGLDTLRAYVVALDVVADFGDHTVKVA